MRRTIRYGVTSLAGLLLLFAAAALLLHTEWARRAAFTRLRDQLREQNILLEASGLDYNLLALRAGLRDVKVRSAQAPDLPPIATIGEARVVLNWRALTSLGLDVESATITKPALHLVIEKDGRTNVPLPPPSKIASKPLEWLVRSLVATGGSLRVEDRRHDIDVSLAAWKLTMDGAAATRHHKITLTTEKAGEVLYEGRRLAVDRLAIAATLEKDALDIASALLVSGGSRIELAGRINDFDALKLDLRAKSILDPAPLAAFAGIPEKVAGRIELEATATGAVAGVKIAATVAGNGIAYGEFSGVALAAKGRYDAAAARARVEELTVESPYGSARATGDVALGAGESSIAARVDRVDLERLARRAKVSVLPSARAAMTLQARFPGLAFEQAAGSGTIRLTPALTDAAANRLPVAADISFNGRADRMTAVVRSLTAGGVEASGTVELTSRTNLSGALTIGAGSLAEVLRQASLVTSSDVVIQGLDGRAAIQATLGGTIGKPAVEASLDVQELQADPVRGATLNATAAWRDDEVTVSGLALRWKGQAILADGSLNLKGSSPALNLTARTDHVAIETILAGIGHAEWPVAGGLRADLRAGGTLGHPLATVTIAGSGLTAYSESLGALEARAELDGKQVRLSGLRLEKGLEASGTYHLESGAYTVEAHAAQMRIERMELPGGVPVRGTVAFAASGAGTVSDPRLNAKLSVAGLTVQDAEYGTIELAAVVANRAADLQASAPKYDVTAKARVGLDTPHAASIQVNAGATDLRALPLPSDLPLRGAIRAALEGQGELDNWRKATATLRVEPVGLEWNKEAVTTEGPILAEFSGGTVQVKQARVMAAGSSVAVTGSLPMDAKSTDGLLRVQGEVDLARATALIPEWPDSLTVSGRVAIAAEVRGNLARMDPTATVSWRDGTIVPKGLNPVSEIQLDVQLKDGALLLERLAGTWAKARIEARGEFPLALVPAGLPVEFPRKQGPASLTLDARGLDVSAIEGVPENASGTVSLHVEAEAAKADLESLKARATFEELRVRVGEFALEQIEKSTLTAADGAARIESLTLAGPGTELTLRGQVGLKGEYPVAVRVAGKIETGVLSMFVSPVKLRGPLRLQLSAYGPASDLKAAGFVELTDGQMSMPEPRIAAENVNARIELTGDRLTIARFDGLLNGGTLKAKGGLRFTGGEARDIGIALDADNVYLDYPFGLRTLSKAAITLRQDGEQIVLGGGINILEGSFRDPLTMEGNLLGMLNSPPDSGIAAERNPYLDRMRFDLGIKTDAPLLVNNNLAKAGLNMDLRLAGNYYQPSLLGRITLDEGGELYFAERSYAVERGVITFTSEQKIEPSFDILARTRTAGHDISLLISGGGAEKIQTTLTSEPPASEPDILAMLITGKPLDDIRGNDAASMAGRQALSYFAGSFGSRFTRQIERATGLSMVRVEPDLIANESNPTARLTVGQDFTNQARLIYSMNLANGGDQIYIAEYDLTKRFTTKAVKQIDNTYRFEFRHDLRFGGDRPERSAKSRERKLIGTVRVPSDGPIPEKTLRDRFKMKPGKKYDFFEVRKGLDRLEALHRKEDLLEARVRVQREVKERSVDLDVAIEAGPRVSFVYEGWEPGRRLRKRVREIWHEGVFDAQRVDEAVQALRTQLIGGGYLEAKIESAVAGTGPKRVTFDIRPGVKYASLTIEFPGAGGIGAGELRSLLKHRKMRPALYLDVPKVRELVQGYYHERGYLDAKTEAPRYEFHAEARAATVRMEVREGPRYKVGSVRFAGNAALKTEALAEKSALKAEEPYLLPLRQKSLDQLSQMYLSAGYHDAQVEAAVERGNGAVDVTFRVKEGPREVVSKIEVEGNRATSQKLVSGQVALKEGDALEPAKLAESRRNLYSTGAFSLVDLERIPAGPVGEAGVRPVLLRARVREVQPFDIRYGAYYDTERGPGAVVDFTNRNSLGSARALGGRLRYDGNFREARVFFSQPQLRRFPVHSIVSAYVNRELLPSFITDRRGVSAQQEIRFRRHYLLNYGYRLERVHTYEKTPDPFLPFDVTLRVAPLTFSMNRETRDDILDATKGSFLSNALEWAPPGLGSDVRFVRYYGQYFRYVALSKPSEIPLSGGLMKPRLVYAGAARLGLAGGLGGQELIRTERFFAGGGTSLRGFQQNSLGPVDFLGEPAGGNAVLILNNELRFPAVSIFDGVGFVDVGNTYSRASDLRLTDLRKTAGAGLRVRTPYFLLRLDYGFKLDRRPGESRGAFFFSIGQAF